MSPARSERVRAAKPPARAVPWTACVLGALVATSAAMAAMFWLRFAYQIRTLPERVMEWVLLFVSPKTLEEGITRFGADAKVYALYVAVAGMAVILIAIGVTLLRYASSTWALAAAGPLLYLVAMGVVMPVTGAGPFGFGLFQDWRLVNAGYLVVAMTFATPLVLVRLAADRRPRGSASRESVHDTTISRRTAIASATTTVLAAIATVWFGQRGSSSGSSLPLARIPATPGADVAGAPAAELPRPAAPAKPAGTAAGALAPTVAPTAPPPPTPLPPTPVPAIVSSPARPTAPPSPASAAAGSGLPTPPDFAKQLVRDENGAVVGGVREPGTLTSLITPPEHHYYVTKNPVSDPVIKPEGWDLAFDGEVNSPVRVDYAGLRQLPAIELVKTLECISNPIDMCENTELGCELIGTARWKGVRLTTLLDLAGGVKPGVVAVSIISEDEYTSTIPIEAALDPNTIVAYEMNGAVLPYQHGYPARLLVPGRYGYKSAKWIRVIRPARRAELDWYGQRNWSATGLVHTMTRIDVPAPSVPLPAGSQRLAGIAYAADRGVSKVEYSADGGQTWATARLLEPQPGPDAWVRWEGSFTVVAGSEIQLVVRATDGQGVLQQEVSTPTYPDGATGWHHLTVTGA